jgi:hypothetical protein
LKLWYDSGTFDEPMRDRAMLCLVAGFRWAADLGYCGLARNGAGFAGQCDQKPRQRRGAVYGYQRLGSRLWLTTRRQHPLYDGDSGDLPGRFEVVAWRALRYPVM